MLNTLVQGKTEHQKNKVSRNSSGGISLKIPENDFKKDNLKNRMKRKNQGVE